MMRQWASWVAVVGMALGLAGCQGEQPTPAEQSAASNSSETPAADENTAGTEEQQEIEDSLAKLDPADRALAEKQKYCLVSSDERLGSMGVPVKIDLKGEPAFLCCEGCKEAVEKDADKYLAKLHELKGESPKAE